MKKLSLFSLLGLTGLLAFVATPIYAQEDEVVAEDVVVEAENVVDEAIDETADVVDETIDDTINFDGMEDFNSIFENEEVQNALAEAGVTNEEAAGLIGGAVGLLWWFLAGLGIAALIIGLVLAILTIIAWWKIFEKAGEAGWKALIPVYNVYIMYKIAGMKNWFWYSLIAIVIALLLLYTLWGNWSVVLTISEILLAFAGIVAIVAVYKLPRKFGWGVFTSILFVLFYPICILILGFGSSKYQGKSETVVEA